MTKPNSSLLVLIVDASSSMGRLQEATIAGFNTFVTKQKEEPGEAVVDLTQFADFPTHIFTNKPLAEVPQLTAESYRPYGNTALLDTLGMKINEIGMRLAEMPENERPSKVVFVVQTDGEENASRRFDAEQIREMIKHQREVYSWDFIFLGANIDAVQTAQTYGINVNNAIKYSADVIGTSKAFAVASVTTRSSRNGQELSYSSNLRSLALDSTKSLAEVEAELAKLQTTTTSTADDTSKVGSNS